MSLELMAAVKKEYLQLLGLEADNAEAKQEDFVELHFHTEHSALDGATRIEDVVKVVKEHGQTAIAVTDHGTMSGIHDVYKECKKAGIKFLPAMEPYMVEDLSNVPIRKRTRKKKKAEETEESDEKKVVDKDDDQSLEEKKDASEISEVPQQEERTYTSLDREGHIILIAKNEVGYRNLLQLHYLGYQNKRVNTYGRVVPRLDLRLIELYKEGLIAGTACLGSLISQAVIRGDLDRGDQLVQKYKQIFGDDFYLELQPVGFISAENDKLEYRRKATAETERLQLIVNKQLVLYAQKHNVLLCVTSDAHYARREDRETHALLLAIQSKKDITDDRCFYFPASYMLSSEQLITQFPAQWIKNTKTIADRCEDPKYLDFSKAYKIPKFPVPNSVEFETWKGQL
jgi:DNA polymerase-3 subunit alpha